MTEEGNRGGSGCSPGASLKTLTTYKLDKSATGVNWKAKLRERCCRRVREDRARLLWRMRSIGYQQTAQKENVTVAFKDIVTEELRNINGLSHDKMEDKCRLSGADDMLWEYDGLHSAYQGECEEVLLEMQRIFYEDFDTEDDARESSEVLVDEEDEFLARAVYEYMQLNDEKAIHDQTWCPVCNKGELQETSNLVHCNLCEFQVQRGDEVNLAFLRDRLAEAYDEHLDRGCRSKPGFRTISNFGLTALYIECQRCGTFDVVV